MRKDGIHPEWFAEAKVGRSKTQQPAPFISPMQESAIHSRDAGFGPACSNISCARCSWQCPVWMQSSCDCKVSSGHQLHSCRDGSAWWAPLGWSPHIQQPPSPPAMGYSQGMPLAVACSTWPQQQGTCSRRGGRLALCMRAESALAAKVSHQQRLQPPPPPLSSSRASFPHQGLPWFGNGTLPLHHYQKQQQPHPGLSRPLAGPPLPPCLPCPQVFCNGVEVMTVGGTKKEYNVDIYSGNHPFYQVRWGQGGGARAAWGIHLRFWYGRNTSDGLPLRQWSSAISWTSYHMTRVRCAQHGSWLMPYVQLRLVAPCMRVFQTDLADWPRHLCPPPLVCVCVCVCVPLRRGLARCWSQTTGS